MGERPGGWMLGLDVDSVPLPQKTGKTEILSTAFFLYEIHLKKGSIYRARTPVFTHVGND